MKCAACKGPYHQATGHAWSENFVLCGRCALDFYKWYKARMNSMHARLKNKKTKVRMKESFHDCACKWNENKPETSLLFKNSQSK